MFLLINGHQHFDNLLVMAFKDKLRDEIEFRGLLIKEVSSAVGISNSTFLSYIDARGVLPNVETAVKIADYLGVSVEYLVNDKKENESEQDDNQLSPKIRKLISTFKNLSEHDQSILLSLADVMEKKSPR